MIVKQIDKKHTFEWNEFEEKRENKTNDYKFTSVIPVYNKGDNIFAVDEKLLNNVGIIDSGCLIKIIRADYAESLQH